MRTYYTLVRTLSGITAWIAALLAAWYESATGQFLTFHQRPMYAKDIHTEALPGSDYSHCAIVLQGPLLKKHNFTLETVRLYKKHFPGAHIIVSTWRDEDRAYVGEIQRDAAILLNTMPDYRGPNNINLQITGARAGVRLARERSASYILKTRTDQRLYNPTMLTSLIDLVNHFPPQESTLQKKRLVGLSCGNMRDFYRLADMFLFGDTDDMVRYWEAALVGKQSPAEKEYTTPEAYLFREYIKKIGGKPMLTTSESENAYRAHCIFVDPALVDWYWYKYKRHREYRYTNYKNRWPLPVSFLEWLHGYLQATSP